jgi:pimeloyl-ACP methyl ester carboxylesterase
VDRDLRVFGYGRWDERAQAHAASTDGQMSLRATAAFASESFRAEGQSFLAALRRVEAPTLVIVGDLDGLTGAKAGYIVAGCLPHATVVEIPDAAHYPWVDTPDQFRRTVTSFLTV